MANTTAYDYYYKDNDDDDDYYEYYYDDDGIESTVSEQVRHSMKVASMVLFSITCLLGIPGNAFVIWIAGWNMKKTVTTIWYVTLAVADLLCCLTMPLFIAEIMLYGEAMCKILYAVLYFNMFSSVFILTLISLDRLVLVIWPVWAQNHRSIFRARLLCGLAWFLSLLLCLPGLIYRNIVEKNNRTFCMYTNLSAIKFSGVSRSVFGFLVPLLVITVCYVSIARKVSVRQFKSQKALRIMVGVVTAFFICWMPFHTLRLVIAYGNESTDEVARAVNPLALSLACINSCLNPVLYVFMGQEFKERFRVSMRRIFENAFSDDPNPSSVGSKKQVSQLTHLTRHHSL